MKNMILTLAMLFSAMLFAQAKNTEPTFEKDGAMIKATYFHDNGKIAQTGHLLNNKLHGEWVSFSSEGKKTGIAQYNMGNKNGKWFFCSDGKLTEVDYYNNKIVNVIKKDSEIL